ncbi:6403_t:CDS:2, partial [Rhizophagus irregularis]
NIYELSARSEVSKFLGSHYTSKFEIFDLNGLVRLALLRNILLSEKEKALYDSQVYVSSYRVHKLSDFIYTKNMRDCLNSAIEYIRKLPNDNSNYFKNLQQLADKGKIALKKWESFENNSNNKTSEKKLYLTNTRSLCIMLMTSYVLDVKLAIANEQAPFNTILDIDFRGRTSGSDISDVTIELGEIKLSSGNKAIKKAYRQLLLRLAVLSFVVEAMNKDEKNKDEKNVKVKCRLIGKIFVPKISEISIQPRWADGIKFSSFAEYHVDIIKIGEKH